MAEQTDNLNQLLEDALQDLLLEDDTLQIVEKEGEPNIEESLKKITKVNQSSATKENNLQGNGDSNKKNNKPKAGSSKNTNNQKVIDEEEMNRFFANMTEQLKGELPKMGMDEAQARINESVPQIFDLMQNLLSKELLYPALKDLAPKFQEWLQKNSTTLSTEDKRRYKRQMAKINEIIDVFDDESLDSQERFEKNLELMEQMQTLGAPPEELTVPEGMSKCTVM